MKKVCDRHGIVFIADEVMCGMGRTGYQHAWQKEGIVPDIQLVGKGLAGGYAVISAMLVGPKIIDAFQNGSGNGAFNHGHTFQNFPLACASALAVQKYVKKERLVEGVKAKGPKLEKKLKRRLEDHPHVGSIRGDGYFWGVSAVEQVNSRTLTAIDRIRVQQSDQRTIPCI